MIIEHPSLAGDMKKLAKHFPSALTDVRAFANIFSVKGVTGVSGISHYPGFGQDQLYKVRIQISGGNAGKSSGLRLVMMKQGVHFIFIYCYIHSQGHGKAEAAVVAAVKQRIKDTDFPTVIQEALEDASGAMDDGESTY